MHHGSYKINVGDILQNSSIRDTIQFTEKFSTFLPQLVAPGISCTIEVQGLDSHSVLITIVDAQACIQHTCDVCGEDFTDFLVFGKKEITCLFDVGTFDKEDDILIIHPKEKVVDLEQYLVESFLLEDPVVHVCNVCEKRKEGGDDENIDNIGQNLVF